MYSEYFFLYKIQLRPPLSGMPLESPSGACCETQLPPGLLSRKIIFLGVTISSQAHFEDSNLVKNNLHIYPQELCRTEF